MRISIALLSLAFTGCNVPPTAVPTDVKVDSAFELAIGQSARVLGSDATILLLAIPEDSRCPADPVIRCIWAGNGRVRLEVASGGRRDTIDLNTGLDPHETPAGVFNIKLIALNPPKRDAPPIPARDYRVTLIASLRAP